MLASIENMQRNYEANRNESRTVFAYSPKTGERYSADPGDYWNAKPGWIMEDSEGEPMILAVEHHVIERLGA